MTEPNKELTEMLKSMIKPKTPEEIYKSVEGTGEKNNLTFSEAGLLKEVSSKKTKTERKRPEFTLEDGITLFHFSLKHCAPYSKMLVQLDKRFVDDLIVVLTEEPTGEEQTRFVISEIDKFLRVTRVFQQSYKNKEFRKKLKLYVKWLQSEMSKQESSK